MKEKRGVRGVEIHHVQNKIYEIRGRRVMLDFDLAQIYEVETRRLNEAVKRNIKRFPCDFMFQLTKEELTILMSQIATSSWGGTRKMPYAFTEQGVAMLSGILHSDVAIEANISIMRAFVAVRAYLLSRVSESAELAQLRERISKLEQDTGSHTEEISNLYRAIDRLSAKPPLLDPQRRMIGFNRE